MRGGDYGQGGYWQVHAGGSPRGLAIALLLHGNNGARLRVLGGLVAVVRRVVTPRMASEGVRRTRATSPRRIHLACVVVRVLVVVVLATNN